MFMIKQNHYSFLHFMNRLFHCLCIVLCTMLLFFLLFLFLLYFAYTFHALPIVCYLPSFVLRSIHMSLVANKSLLGVAFSIHVLPFFILLKLLCDWLALPWLDSVWFVWLRCRWICINFIAKLLEFGSMLQFVVSCFAWVSYCLAFFLLASFCLA